MPKTQYLSLPGLVDALGAAKALSAEATQVESDLRGQLVEYVDGAYEGERYRAAVTTSDYTTIAQELLVAKLAKTMGQKAFNAWYKRNSRTNPRTIVKVSARIHVV